MGRLAGLWMCSLGLAIVGAVSTEERLIDVERSTITVRVASEGPLSAFSTDVVVQAVLAEGSVEESVPHMQVVIDARRLRVLDSGLAPATREAIQARMLGADVLDVSRFPRISYHSITIEPQRDAWLIRGELELHGTILPVTSIARREGDRYHGTATVRPSAFGIAPVSRWGGLMRVKDEVAIEFDVALGGLAPVDIEATPAK